MSKFNKKNKKSKKNNRKNYKIESLEPRLLMDASVNDWNDELNALNVGAYTIDSDSSKIDGLLVVDTNDMDKELERLSLADVVNGQKVDFQQEWKDVKVHVKDCVDKVYDDAMKPYDDEVGRCRDVYDAANALLLY
ncbi:LEPR-XLL domain-containing protein [uncultured Fibrobacter sp.]|uniref:LEPR-XLL domain-containing protein n=1 Tax=uncultured Fibrobacter sp. TaxID=261512 RepID=UPI0026122789|nr:LEPR-XLL domain-containing protein [uncultured Fibrobacter sp.]